MDTIAAHDGIDHDLSAIREIALARICDASPGDVARILRRIDPDGEWPSSAGDLVDHAVTIAKIGIMESPTGEEACAVLATVLVETASEAALDSFGDDFDTESGTRTEMIDTLTIGLVDGAIKPRSAASMLAVAR